MGLTLKELAKQMRGIDITMLNTHKEGGQIAARPMSNNGDVEYDGDSHFFCLESTGTVADIKRDAKVGMTLQGNKGILGKPGIAIAIEGLSELIHDKAVMKKHWTPDLERWFKDGVDTKGLVLIKVHAKRITYWDGEDEGTVTL